MTTPKQASPKLFVLYDSRARSGDASDASVFDTADSIEEAKALRGDYAKDSIWFEYDIDEDGKTLINERPRYDIKV